MKAKHTSGNVDMHAAFSSILEGSKNDALALILNHLELTRRAVEWFMQSEVTELAGERYSHDKPHDGRFSRWGSNPGSVSIGGQKVPVDVPRMYDAETNSTLSPASYLQLREVAAPSPQLMNALLIGLSTRRLRDVAETLLDSFGLSKTTLSEAFIEHSREILETFMQRRLDDATYVAILVDGKVIQGHSILTAIGITETGQKRMLGLSQATTENADVIVDMFRDMIERGFDFEQGLLVVIDGGKGLRKAVDGVFGDYAIIQRCQVHKLRNVMSYLDEEHQATMLPRLKKLFRCEDYNEAMSIADGIHADLKSINIVAARSFQEGLEETLTVTRLKVPTALRSSFTTTNIIESVNSTIAQRTRRITNWSSPDQRLRWTAAIIVDAEQKWRKVRGSRLIPMLRRLIQQTVNERILNSSSKPTPKRVSTRKRT
jgi:transposase-like protein